MDPRVVEEPELILREAVQPAAAALDDVYEQIEALAAAGAEGTTVVSGAAELRVKESDRITAVVAVTSLMSLHSPALTRHSLLQRSSSHST